MDNSSVTVLPVFILWPCLTLLRRRLARSEKRSDYLETEWPKVFFAYCQAIIPDNDNSERCLLHKNSFPQIRLQRFYQRLTLINAE